MKRDGRRSGHAAWFRICSDIRVLFGLVVLLWLPVAAHGGPLTFDLRDDWSDTTNPNGPWSYNDGAGAITTHFADYIPGVLGPISQPAWAHTATHARGHVVSWFKSTNDKPPVFLRPGVFTGGDWALGDVVTHTWDVANGARVPHANVAWTAPRDGRIDIAGGAWLGRDIGRAVDWVLSSNGREISRGALSDGDPYSRASAFDFAAGSGGGNALRGIDVAAGDRLMLALETRGTAGELVGVDLRIAYERQPAVIRLGELRLKIDGDETIGGGAPQADLAGFDPTTGLGEIVVRVTGAGGHKVSLLADHEIDADANGLSRERGEARGTALPGQSWEIDEPGFGGGGYFGDILANFKAHALDRLILENPIDGTVQLSLEDIALAMGWDFDLAANEAAQIRFLLSLIQPSDGFYLMHRDDESDAAIYLSSTIERFAVAPPSDVPAPSSALLLLPGLALLGRLLRPARGDVFRLLARYRIQRYSVIQRCHIQTTSSPPLVAEGDPPRLQRLVERGGRVAGDCEANGCLRVIASRQPILRH